MKAKKRNKFLQFAIFLLAVLFVGSSVPARAATVEANPTVRIGLFYGSSALAGANLANDVGSGYRFG